MRCLVRGLFALALTLTLGSCGSSATDLYECSCRNDALQINNTRLYSLCESGDVAQSDAVGQCNKEFGAGAQCTCTCTLSGHC